MINADDPPVGCFRCGKTNEAAPLVSETPAGVRYVCEACARPGERIEPGVTLRVVYVGIRTQ